MMCKYAKVSRLLHNNYQASLMWHDTALLGSSFLWQSRDEEVVGELVSLLATLCRTGHPWEEVSAPTLFSTLTLAIPSSKVWVIAVSVFFRTYSPFHMHFSN